MRHWMIAAALVAALGCDDHTEGAAPAVVGEAEAAPAEPAEAAEEAAEGEAAEAEDDSREALTIDAARSSVGFTGAKITDSHTGRFADFSGTMRLDPETVTNSQVSITIQTASVQIEPERLRTHLVSGDFFGVDEFPTASFESTALAPAPEGTEDATHLVTGRLTLHGQTRSITFPATIEVTDGEVHARAEFTIDRQQFGITYPGMPDDLIRDEVVIRFDVRAPRGSA